MIKFLKLKKKEAREMRNLWKGVTIIGVWISATFAIKFISTFAAQNLGELLFFTVLFAAVATAIIAGASSNYYRKKYKSLKGMS